MLVKSLDGGEQMSTILHVDMDAFFAAVEILDNPEYQGKPVIVGGRKDSKRGVVSTCSYEARAYGVHSAMPIQQAVKLCPNAIFIPGRMSRYQEVSQKIHEIFPQFSPIVEPLSIDEAFLDMTGCEHFYKDLYDMGAILKNRIKSEVGITASVGIAPNKFLAKLASGYKKPDGLVVLKQEDVQSFLAGLPVGKLWGVGDKSQIMLRKQGILTVKDLLQYSEEWLVSQFGNFGTHLYKLARGIDDRKVEPSHQAKSIGQEVTFNEDYDDPEILKTVIAQLTEKVGWRLRHGKMYARTVTLKVRYYDFKTITRAHTLPHAIDDDDSIYNTAIHLFNTVELKPIRLIGVTVSNLTTSKQLFLFETEQRNSKLSEVMDKVNNKFTKTAITRGRTILPQNKRER